MTENSRMALEVLRKPSETFSWYIIPLLLVVIYVYAKEAQKRDWNVLLGGLAFWGMDLFNEIWNSIVFHASGFAPVWGAPFDSALLILIGYNIEISFMFAIMGIVACSTLPKDRSLKIAGIPNRVVFAAVGAIFCVIVECVLNYWGALTWEFSWWRIGVPWLIWLIGYLPFFGIAYFVHDLKTMKAKFITLGALFGVDILLLVIFGSIGWM